MESSSSEVQNYLVRRIDRIHTKIQTFQRKSKIFSNVRMVIFGMGVLLTWLAASYLGTLAAWLVFGSVLVVFLIVAFLHKRLEDWVFRFMHWQSLYQGQLARSQLDWSVIPYRKLPEQKSQKPLEVDLSLTGLRSLHHLLDCTISDQGSILLADWISQSEPDLENISKRQKWIKELVKFPFFCMRFHLVFSLASKEKIHGDQVTSWLNIPFDSKRLRWSLPTAILLTMLNLGLFIANIYYGLPAYWLISMVLYLIFYNFTGRENSELLNSIAAIDVELGKLKPVFQYLEGTNYRNKPGLRVLCEPFYQPDIAPSRELRRLKWVTAAAGLRMNPVTGFLLNIFLPWDYIWASLAAYQRERLELRFPVWLDHLFQLEALLSLANFLRFQTGYSFPTITTESPVVLRARKVSHPLLSIKSRVANNFQIDEIGDIALITGSNMAGKSTFLRTIGINLCLAYAGSAVLAEEWHSLPMQLHSCIQISDSIGDGFSYFYAEVKCLSNLLNKLVQNTFEETNHSPVLYLIDEIFRGTNNRERLTGSLAYLKAAIQGNGVGLIATHDLELAYLSLQTQKVRNFYFCDRVENGRLVFDYLIRNGISPTTNALKIMAMEGLPVD